MNKKQLDALESERNDISYRKQKRPPVVSKPKHRPADLLALEERFKRMYFHAGRYSAGARDTKAQKEWQAYESFEGLSAG